MRKIVGVEPFVTERSALLAEGNHFTARYQELGATDDGWAAYQRFSALHARYQELLPDIVVSRCPFTGQLVYWPLDIADVDGWFWMSSNPVRRLDPVPHTWLLMAGAMRLDGPPAPAPFARRVGPDVPYVYPQVLGHPEIRAVITQLRVGPHTGWPITYHCSVYRPRGIALEPVWGSDHYDVVRAPGRYAAWDDNWGSNSKDFDLRPWLDSGKLQWIAPDDATATLRTGSADCPYPDLPGTRKYNRLF
ncbi:hypothetical protein [Nocardia canadensis]|uniref:hypothetical protein n=1 Tax=Nocardia canadensis TaxID=3065238 RepID=UPI00292FAEB7|nr:hypothetical protein [Nocardia canadensis]